MGGACTTEQGWASEQRRQQEPCGGQWGLRAHRGSCWTPLGPAWNVGFLTGQRGWGGGWAGGASRPAMPPGTAAHTALDFCGYHLCCVIDEETET